MYLQLMSLVTFQFYAKRIIFHIFM
ncbi:UNVERIFIED_CONTAM: hypothetical protein GTU68_050184 [Idotea baltica]|nr:hypothetical protein [Idotea baltica]